MTDEQIENIAYLIYGTKITPQEYAFAKLVAEAEREACAKICDLEKSDSLRDRKHLSEQGVASYAGGAIYAERCAEAIRARGQE